MSERAKHERFAGPLIAATFLLGSACSRAAGPRPPVGVCPPLVRGSGSLQTTYTSLVGFEGFEPGACVDVLLGGQSIGREFVGRGGSFAVQLVLRGDARGQGVLVRVEPPRGAVRMIPVVIPTGTHADIEYEPDTTPIIVERGQIVFRGLLASTIETQAPISDATFVNFRSGANEDILPTPRLDEAFEARVTGTVGTCATVLSWHGANRWGGCWWPIGGNQGCSSLCTREEYEAGSCLGGSCSAEDFAAGRCSGDCTPGRGCTPIRPDEPPRPPPPERPDVIPTAPPAPRPPPPDAAAADADLL